MAGSRGSAASKRRHESREDPRTRWIYIGAAAILAAVGIIVVVGLIFTWWMPPREHVLTVGGREFTARDVADRARYLAIDAQSQAAQLAPADEGIDSFVRQEVLLQVGPNLVEPVTDADLRDAIRLNLGLPDNASEEAFADAYREFLRGTSLSQDAYEEITRAGLYEDRLLERFKGEVEESGEQMHLRAVATPLREQADALIEAVRGGEDFAQAALDTGVADSADQVFDLGWFAPEVMNESIRDEVIDLQAGEVSEVVVNPGSQNVVVYFVEERTTDEEYREEVRDQLAARDFRDFVDAQEEAVGVEIDLSDSEREWIQRRVLRAVRDG